MLKISGGDIQNIKIEQTTKADSVIIGKYLKISVKQNKVLMVDGKA